MNLTHVRSLSLDFEVYKCLSVQKVPESLPAQCQLVNLKILKLGHAPIPGHELECLISYCPVLEKLRLEHCWRGSLSIRAPSLLSLEIWTQSPVGLSLKDLNQLEHAFFSFNCNCENENETGQMVELLMNLTHVRSLSLDFEMYKCLSVQKVPESLPAQCQLVNLKILKLKISLVEATAVFLLSCLLRSCPHLKDFFIVIQEESYEPPKHCVELDYWEKQKPSECLMYHLRTVEIHWLHLCRDYEIGFVKYLLMNAHVLKRLTIAPIIGSSDKLRDAAIGLSLLRKASPCAVLEFDDVQYY
ncbi:F-box/FBD/LRR-repeat protein At1g13570-like [Tasmannia lanceolata]|uniref:F-box/FBD/LRR-repeat protein At1g13570-like n=1 Tax=Tasmannia lanceolata TaxID=3420 RepID=UPI004063CBC4